MSNLVKAEFFKLRKSLAFKVLLVCAAEVILMLLVAGHLFVRCDLK